MDNIALHAAYCYTQLADYREARDALAVEAWSPGSADITRLELGIALAHCGSPDEQGLVKIRRWYRASHVR